MPLSARSNHSTNSNHGALVQLDFIDQIKDFIKFALGRLQEEGTIPEISPDMMRAGGRYNQKGGQQHSGSIKSPGLS